jgi:hypothetical protein
MPKPQRWLALGACFLLVVSCLTCASARDLEINRRAIPETFQDPAVPMIALPTEFTSHRANSDRRIPAEGFVEIANLKGPGCVRHIWLLPGENVRLVIQVDGADQPQVDMPIKPFFAVMHGLKPYYVDCAAYNVLPNPAPGVDGDPGYNLFLPIPFSKSCRITLRGPQGERGVAMVDWHAYKDASPLTPYRLHAAHRLETPAGPRGSFIEMANVEGKGFVAGVAVGYLQRNKSDMVFHTGGMTLLLDGETKPNAIRGHNVEDDYGFTWGFNDHQTRWMGCPYQVNRGRENQDGVFYRFFGPDPIAFSSSLLFRNGTRSDDMETVVYYYLIPGTKAPVIQTPAKWQVAGLLPATNGWEDFQQTEFVESLPAGEWPDKLTDGKRSLTVYNLESKRGWIDLQNIFFERHHTATPLTILNQAAYARTTLPSEKNRRAVLRLAVDDWAIVWLNGKQVAALRHEDGLRTAEINVQLQKGDNELLIKINNTDTPLNKRLWVIHTVLEP